MPTGGTWQTEEEVIWRTQSWSDWGQWQDAELSPVFLRLLFVDITHPDDTSSHGKGLYQERDNRRNKWDCFGGPPQHQSDARFYLQVPGLLASLGSPWKCFSSFLRLLMCGMHHIFPPIVIKKKWLSGSNAYWFFKAQLFIQWCLECDASKITIILIAPGSLYHKLHSVCSFTLRTSYTTLMGQIWWSGNLLIYHCKWYTFTDLETY